MNLWVVGKVFNKAGTKWEFCGVFDDKEKAEAACHGNNYFIGPIALNQELPLETIDWPGAWYPKVEDEP